MLGLQKLLSVAPRGAQQVAPLDRKLSLVWISSSEMNQEREKSWSLATHNYSSNLLAASEQSSDIGLPIHELKMNLWNKLYIVQKYQDASNN